MKNSLIHEIEEAMRERYVSSPTPYRELRLHPTTKQQLDDELNAEMSESFRERGPVTFHKLEWRWGEITIHEDPGVSEGHLHFLT